MHAVHVASGGIAVPLCAVFQALALWEETANDTVGILVRAALPAAIRVTVIDFAGQSLHSSVILELAAVVYGDGLERALRVVFGGF